MNMDPLILYPLLLLIIIVVSTALVNLIFFIFKKGKKDENVRGPEVVDLTNGSRHSKDASAQIMIANVGIFPKLETQHFLFAGQTGTGKSQCIARILSTVRSRRSRALVADAAGSFMSKLLADGDLILNPFDERSVDWNPFVEIRTDYDCARIARAAIPDGTGESKEWNHYAQVLLGETLFSFVQEQAAFFTLALHLLSSADQQELFETLQNTPAAVVCSPGNERMLAGVRSIIAVFLQSWRYLSEEGTFSVRDWVTNDGSQWLFLTYRDDQAPLLRPLVSTILEMAITEGLSLNEDPSRDLWFVLDEVDSLGKISALRDGLSKLRKYGGKCVLGLQTISQLRATYGKDEAQTLMANIATKMVLRAGDGETAEYFSGVVW